MITHFAVWAFAGLAFWWLSGYDAKVTGGNKKQDFIRRATRCGKFFWCVRGRLVARP